MMDQTTTYYQLMDQEPCHGSQLAAPEEFLVQEQPTRFLNSPAQVQSETLP
jgi:hypothetical protein